MPPNAELLAARESTVRAHMASENDHDFEATLATFSHPRYELVATDTVYDGEAEVRRYYDETRTAFPDQRNELRRIYTAGDAVVVELDLLGTHLGPYRGLPPTGRSFTCPMIAVFLFEPGESKISCERVYFDAATILRQLGILHDPLTLKGRIVTVLNHPVTIGGAMLRQLLRKRQGG